jgi:hypothetical protein
MLRACSLAFWFVGLLSFASFAANAQEVVHALAGIVTSINPTQKTIFINTDDGSEGLFKEMTNSNVALDFEKDIRADSTPADAFTNKGAHAIIYYFGNGDERTAVAFQDLGAGPLKKMSGEVHKYDKHQHLLTIKDTAGVTESFHIDHKTVAETAVGVVDAERFDLQKGAHVRVTATVANGNQEALFVRSQ